ncbi:hypothetical protein JBE27_54480, partial [Streptomyces albiflaviniger]|nr:hypothetical protein [Streptomyces albiflaviniger]
LGLDTTLPSERPERLAQRAAPPSRTARWATTALMATVVAGVGRAASRRTRRGGG